MVLFTFHRLLSRVIYGIAIELMEHLLVILERFAFNFCAYVFATKTLFPRKIFVLRGMIFEQPFFYNFCDNIIFHIYVVFLFSLSIILIFVSILTFFVYFSCPTSYSNKGFQITFLLFKVKKHYY